MILNSHMLVYLGVKNRVIPPRLNAHKRKLAKRCLAQPDAPLLTTSEAEALGLEEITTSSHWNQRGRHTHDTVGFTHALGDEHVLALVAGDITSADKSTAEEIAARQSARMAHTGRKREWS